MEKPNSIATRRVAVQYVIGAVDGADADDEPDFIPARGVVEFTASVAYTPYPVVSGPNPMTVLNAMIRGVLDSEGYLCTPDPANSTLPGKRGVRLLCTDNVDGSVANWTWTAEPKFVDANGTRIPDVIPRFSFYLPSDPDPNAPDLDLTTVVKVPASQGIGNAQAEALAALASAAAASSADSAETAVAAALDVKRRADAGEFKGEDGKPGPAGPNTVPTQEAVAGYVAKAGNPVNAAILQAVRQPVLSNKPMQAATQAPVGRLIMGVADGGNTLLSWNQYGIAQSDNGGGAWIGRNVPTGVGASYATAGKAAVVKFKGNWYLQAVKTTDGLPSIFRAAPITGAGSFAWSEPLITGAAGSTLFSCALDADDQYIYWGEYGDPTGGPALWRSADGTAWEKVIASGSGIGRHIHGVAADPYNPGHVYVSGGDTSSTVYNMVSKDYGATWKPMPSFGTDGAWQACQISFDANYIYYAADTITAMGAYKVDRATGKPSWLTRETHRNRDIPGGMPPRKISDLATTLDSYKVTSATANFGPDDVGSRLRVKGQDIVPIDTYIRTVDSPTQVTLWQPAKLTATGLTAIFGGETWGAASYYGSVDARTGIFYFSTLNGAFGGNVDGLFAIYPDGQLILLNILTTSPDARMYIVPEKNILWVQGFSHSLLSI